MPKEKTVPQKDDVEPAPPTLEEQLAFEKARADRLQVSCDVLDQMLAQENKRRMEAEYALGMARAKSK